NSPASATTATNMVAAISTIAAADPSPKPFKSRVSGPGFLFFSAKSAIMRFKTVQQNEFCR
ncbi:hypothetical protein, partial [Rhizobium sp. UBA1881]|uniref:hypothetical protein n=1 Tax=Rhizobium sp. UBA1881 TaxID=1947375 RepID=UPI0025ED8F99